MDSFDTFLTFFVADSSADEALALGGRNVDVGDEDTDLEDLEGLLEMLLLVAGVMLRL